MLKVREAQPEEVANVERFYQEVGYSGGLSPSDRLVVAEANNALLGAHRICSEQGVLVLRGMRVREEHQRQGIGTAMLELSRALVGDRPCYCIPYRYLSSFYARVGFKEIGNDQAPEFLRHRFDQYRNLLHLDVIIMRFGNGSLAAFQERGAR